MKRILLFAALSLCFSAGLLAAARLPADRSALIQAKYDTWCGVLRVWVADDCGAFSPVGWLNTCAAEAEKQFNGVYISVREVPAQAVSSYIDSGVAPPDVLVYPSGLVADFSGLAPITAAYPLRLGVARDAYAVPLMLDPRFWIYDAALGALPADMYETSAACRESELDALTALCTGLRDAEAETMPLPGVDLGLEGEAVAEPPQAGTIRCRVSPDLILTDDPRAAFINREASAFVGGTGDVLKLGDSTDFSCAVTGEYACAANVLMCSMISSGDGRDEVSRTFIDILMSEGQALTARAKGFPAVSGASAWAGDPMLASVEAALEGRVWLLNAGAGGEPARLYIEGNISADEAMRRIIGGE